MRGMDRGIKEVCKDLTVCIILSPSEKLHVGNMWQMSCNLVVSVCQGPLNIWNIYIKYMESMDSKDFLSQHFLKFRGHLFPKNMTIFISNQSVFSMATPGFLGYHQLTVEFLNVLYVLSLVCSIHQTLNHLLI